MLDNDPATRKTYPLAKGVIDYFPDALADVAHVSYVGNQQHNPGQPLHWDRQKSSDHADCILRHMIDRGFRDTDGLRHSAKVAWRALAQLQVEIEESMDNIKFSQTNEVHTPAVIGPLPTRGRREFPPVDNIPDPPPLDLREGREIDYKPPHISFPDLVGQLFQLGCPTEVASQIAGGASYAISPRYTKWAYVSGPMRGFPDHNAPVFEKARNLLLGDGYNVISPVDMDNHTGNDSALYVLRDFWALYFVARQKGVICLLPSWENSVGAAGEFFTARFLQMGVCRCNRSIDRLVFPLPESLVHEFALVHAAQTPRE